MLTRYGHVLRSSEIVTSHASSVLERSKQFTDFDVKTHRSREPTCRKRTVAKYNVQAGRRKPMFAVIEIIC